ncbi:MAG: hypothetical protein LBD25_03395 [Coriobacteriales bacterium]|jgi:hypothetical protein|nr:hypothetical protein [Coriobacteriales bacterium]
MHDETTVVTALITAMALLGLIAVALAAKAICFNKKDQLGWYLVFMIPAFLDAGIVFIMITSFLHPETKYYDYYVGGVKTASGVPETSEPWIPAIAAAVGVVFGLLILGGIVGVIIKKLIQKVKKGE